MGLLRKAANSATRDAEGSIESSSPVSAPLSDRVSRVAASVSGRASRITGAAPRAGLLRKSLALVSGKGRGALRANLPAEESRIREAAAETPRPSEAVQKVREQQDPAEAAREIVAAIQALPDGLELPSQLFSALAEQLSIEKGALLLFDPVRLVYAPWASLGYDQTTLHRMRIPLGANESFNALANGSPVLVEDASTRGAYEQYFSAREFSSLSRILLTPFITAEKLVGVLLLTALKPPFAGDAELLQCLKAIADAGSPRVQKAREKKLRRADSQPVRSGDTGSRNRPVHILLRLGRYENPVSCPFAGGVLAENHRRARASRPVPPARGSPLLPRFLRGRVGARRSHSTGTFRRRPRKL